MIHEVDEGTRKEILGAPSCPSWMHFLPVAALSFGTRDGHARAHTPISINRSSDD
jgi:hypothetical protein